MKKPSFSVRRCVSALFLTLSIAAVSAFAQTSSFTYQGRFTDAGVAQPTNGVYSMTFRLYDALSGGTQIGSPVTASVTVVNSVFTVPLDFGAAAFNTSGARYLEVQVNANTLTPRQQITSSPFSMKATNAGAADSLSANCAACVTDAQINAVAGAKVTGTVANATNAINANNAATATIANSATTAGNVTGVVAVANGGTGSSTQNFVDLSTAQSVGGNKTFTGNVTVNGTLTATLGQSVNTVYGSGGLSLAPTATFTLVPGLTQTINVPAGYSAYVTSGGGIQTTSTAATGFSSVDIGLLIDGSLPSDGAYRRVIAANTTGMGSMIDYWHIGQRVVVSAGSHTFAIYAAGTGGSSATATVGGNNSSVLQGDLTVVLVKN